MTHDLDPETPYRLQKFSSFTYFTFPYHFQHLRNSPRWRILWHLRACSMWDCLCHEAGNHAEVTEGVQEAWAQGCNDVQRKEVATSRHVKTLGAVKLSPLPSCPRHAAYGNCIRVRSQSVEKQDESLEAPSQTPSPPLRIGASIEAGCQENSEQCWCAFECRKQHSLRGSPSPSFYAILCNAESRSQGPFMVSALWIDQISRFYGLSFWFTLWLYGVWRLPCYNLWNQAGYTSVSSRVKVYLVLR